MSSCLKPIHIRIDDEGHTRLVPCGKCSACLIRSRMEWSIRLKEEQRVSAASYFLTLTYDDDHLPIKENVELDTGACFYTQTVSKEDVQLWLKRFRKLLPQLRYYLISEYGPETQRPHYHGIFFFSSYVSENDVLDAARHSWHLCVPERITVSEVTESRIFYVTEYALTRSCVPDAADPNFRLCSRRPGLGATYVGLMKNWHNALSEGRFVAPGVRPGTFVNLPRYYRDKLFSRDQLSDHSALVEYEALKRKGELPEMTDVERNNLRLTEIARVKDYERRTSFFLDKKAKKL